jgi:hypothetical protein
MNAREEFIKHIDTRKVLCAKIQKGDDYDDHPSVFNLTTGWDSEDWSKFLSGIDFEYDSGYGGQNLFGTIWYADGTWSDRGEYDGSEWWDYHTCPNIPAELDRKDKVREQKLNQLL